MKKLHGATFLLIVASLFSSCEAYRMIKTYTDKEEGRIVMKDGTEYAGRVKMPLAKTKTLRMKTQDGQKVKVNSADVAVLGVWKKTHTDKCHFLEFHPYWTLKEFSTKKVKLLKPRWMAVQARGEFVEFYCCSYRYSIPRDGSMTISGTNSDGIFYIARKVNEPEGHMIAFVGSGKKFLREQLVKYLADDPALCEKIKDKDFNPTDFQKIADLYRPDKP